MRAPQVTPVDIIVTVTPLGIIHVSALEVAVTPPQAVFEPAVKCQLPVTAVLIAAEAETNTRKETKINENNFFIKDNFESLAFIKRNIKTALQTAY